MTDNLQPTSIDSQDAPRLDGHPKADRRRYLLLTLGSHPVDSALFLGGIILGLRARLLVKIRCIPLVIAVEYYEDGTLGKLDLQIPIRGDFQEGLDDFREHGSVSGRVHFHGFTNLAKWNISPLLTGSIAVFSGRMLTPTNFSSRVCGNDTRIEGRVDASVHDGPAAMQAVLAVAPFEETGVLVRLEDIRGGIQ